LLGFILSLMQAAIFAVLFSFFENRFSFYRFRVNVVQRIYSVADPPSADTVCVTVAGVRWPGTAAPKKQTHSMLA